MKYERESEQLLSAHLLSPSKNSNRFAKQDLSLQKPENIAQISLTKYFQETKQTLGN